MFSLFATARRVLRLMPHGAHRFYGTYVLVTSSLSILDLLSMGLLALVLAPTISGGPISLPLLGEFPPDAAIWFILAACLLIFVRGIAAVGLHWWATRRFARYELDVGDRLFAAYTELAWSERSRKTTSDMTRIADMGIANTIMGFLIPLSTIPSNALTFVAVAAVLVVSQPGSAVVVTLYLLGVGYVLYAVVSRRALVAGRVNRDYGYRSAAVMTELVEALREVTLRGKVGEVRAHVRGIRKHAVRARAHISFLSIVPKYVIEAALIGGLLLVGAVSYLQDGLDGAIVAVAVFGVTGFRMIPTITGIQASLTQASSNVIHAKNVIHDITDASAAVKDAPKGDVRELPAKPERLVLRDVVFSYPGKDVEVLRGIDLTIPFGSTVGIAGPTGAGKSTLIDILLGLSAPTRGSVEVDGVALTDVQNAWRSRVAYVPQQVALFAGTIAQNVALTWGTDIDEARVHDAMRRAQLDDVLETRAEGIHARVGERGMDLSGGQRQRLGIARALYSDAFILVMDEATSSLDGQTEESVAAAIRELEGEMTIIAVAHRLSTIRSFDTICYLAGGRIVATGGFEELQRAVPEFRAQARLAGLEVTDV